MANYATENDMVIYSFNSGDGDMTEVVGSKASQWPQTDGNQEYLFDLLCGIHHYLTSPPTERSADLSFYWKGSSLGTWIKEFQYVLS